MCVRVVRSQRTRAKHLFEATAFVTAKFLKAFPSCYKKAVPRSNKGTLLSDFRGLTCFHFLL